MPSELDDFFAECAEEAMGVIGKAPMQCGTRRAGGVVTPFLATREQRDSGFWSEITSTAELTRADAATLQLADRSEVIIAGKRFMVRRIEDDPHDPCIRYFLKPA